MNLSEKRTQIYLPLALFRSLKKEAYEEKKSMAQLVREAIENYLASRASNKLDWDNDPLTNMIGQCQADPDLSEHHDRYLYGEQQP